MRVDHLDVDGFHVILVEPSSTEEHATSGPARCILFSHATGIAAGSYLSLLCAWASACQARVYAFDARGFGHTHAAPPSSGKLARTGFGGVSPADISSQLKDDLRTVFWKLKALEGARTHALGAPESHWTLAGHSFGGWLSLAVSHDCHVQDLMLFDIAILPRSTATLWALACLVGRRRLHTLGAATRGRKRRYRSAAEAMRVFSRTPFFRGWGRARIEDYLEANYKSDEAGFALRHDPLWEARIFEAQQPSAVLAFRALPESFRKALRVTLVAGGASDVCHAEAGGLFAKTFPAGRWIVLPDANHMFPFNKEASLVRLLTVLSEEASARSAAHVVEAEPGPQATQPPLLESATAESEPDIALPFAGVA